MDDEIRRIVDSERTRSRLAASRLAALLERARTEAGRLAERFAREEPSLKRVILFGSVAAGRVRSERFDIDLAVEADRLGSLLCIAEESEFRVDLLDLSSTSESFRRIVQERGITLHDSRR